MVKKHPTGSDLKDQVLKLIQSAERPLTKNQIAKILGLKGGDRVELKKILRDMQDEGDLSRGSRRRLVSKASGSLSRGILAVEIVDINEDGDLLAAPLVWEEEGKPPIIHIVEMKQSHREGRSALGLTSRVTVKLIRQVKDGWEASVIRRLERDKRIHLGIFQPNRNGGYISSVNRKDTFQGVHVNPMDARDLSAGDVVQYTVDHSHHFEILKVLGKLDDPHIFSEIAIHNHNIPYLFSEEAVRIAESGKVPALGNRTDFRDLDLVTIDGEDARDFDDAVWAEPDDDERNEGGWRAVVAIADVSYYVRPDSELDREARQRGNSVYFPDRVVPMLPEALSNEMCSLKPHVDRACMAIEMIISAHGKLKSYRVKRGLMNSRARLTYNQVQAAIEGKFDDVTRDLNETVIKPLYGVYKSLLKARDQRGTLDLDVPERQFVFDKAGNVSGVKVRERFDSHKLIEELMIAANVAAAKTLVGKNWPCLFRVHDSPDKLRFANLRQFLKQYRLQLPKTDSPVPSAFNAILHQVDGKPFERIVNELILRSQSQAKYSPHNIGHFGLSLSHYAHFTSPIRRYADLVVHRCLIAALDLGEGGYDKRPEGLESVGEHISNTERAASAAEREVSDRFAIAYVSKHVGEDFDVVIVGVSRFGLFVEMQESGAQGFIPRGSLTFDSFVFDEANHQLVGRRSRAVYQLGNVIRATLVEADTTSNSLGFRVVFKDGEGRARGAGNNGKGKGPKGKFKGRKNQDQGKSPLWRPSGDQGAEERSPQGKFKRANGKISDTNIGADGKGRSEDRLPPRKAPKYTSKKQKKKMRTKPGKW